jgi:hypothetical protein
MPITYTWTATSLIGYPVIDGETDVVTRASYTVLADDGEGHTADYSNFAYTPIDPSVPFIPYADLTNDIVIGWVQYNIGPDMIAAIEGSLAIQIERQIDPPPQPEVLPLPWVPPAPVLEVVPPLIEQAVPVLVVSEPASSDSLTESPVVIETADPTN